MTTDDTIEDKANEREIRRIRQATRARYYTDHHGAHEFVTHCVCGIRSRTGLCEHTEHNDAPAAPERGDAISVPLATEQNVWRVVKTIPERPTSDAVLQISNDDGLRLPWHRQELLEVIARYANGYPKAAKALNEYKQQHSTLIAQQERLIQAAQSVVERLRDLPRYLEKNDSAALASITAEALADLAAAIPAKAITTSEQERGEQSDDRLES